MPAADRTTSADAQRPPEVAVIFACLLTASFVCLWLYMSVLPETLSGNPQAFKFDFAPCYAAWYAASVGHDFYETDTGRRGLQGQVFADLKEDMGIDRSFSAYIYPPQFAWMGSWIVRVRYDTAQTFWVWISAGLWLACVGVLIGRRLARRPVFSACLVMLSLLYPPMARSLELGQVNIVLFALIVSAAWLMARDRSVLAGALLGVAALVKPQLGLLWIYLLWTRRWKAAVSCAVTVLIITGGTMVSLGIEPFRTYVFDVLPRISSGQAYIANQSVYGVLARVFVSDPAYLFADRLMESNFWIDTLSLAAGLAIIVLTLRAIPQSAAADRSSDTVLLEFATVICALLLASRIASIHQFTWVWLAVPAYAAAALRSDTRPPKNEIIAFVVGVGLLFLTWNFFAWFSEHPGLLRLLACNTFAGALLIWICLVKHLRRVVAQAKPTQPS